MSPANTTVHDETCPLLPHSHAEAQTVASPPPTPFPKGPLASLCVVRLVDPIAFTQLFPYVNDFINDLRLTDDPSRIGFYSGLESTFALSQLFSIYHWAKLSDVIGRRPVILAGIVGTATMTIFFGLSTSLAGILVARCLGGIFAGNIAVIHSALGEITDSTNQAIAIPIYGLMYPIGSVLGPLIGGTFSHGASKYPDLFGYAIFEGYPYFLPCLVSAVISVIGVLLGYLFLHETLPSKQKKNKEKCDSRASHTAENLDARPLTLYERPMDIKGLINLPIISALVTSCFALSFIATAFDAVFVLFCYSSIQSGGLSFSASNIGYALATSGGISVSLQMFVMPHLLRKFDCAKIHVFCMTLWPFAYFCLPFLNIIARDAIREGGEWDSHSTAILWVGIIFVLGITRVGALAYSTSLILTKENTPNSASLGKSNGIVQFSMCLARSFAPFTVSSLFAISIDNNLVGGYLWVIIMVFVSILGVQTSHSITLYNKKFVP
ncbi:hypothetical protein ID866_5484 [Astraeus odoratus]|nr:hypothetical protein ID866_5484 [Astraeus odoratus]